MVNVTFTVRELGLRKCLNHYTYVHCTMYNVYDVVHTVCRYYSPLRYRFSEWPLLLLRRVDNSAPCLPARICFFFLSRKEPLNLSRSSVEMKLFRFSCDFLKIGHTFIYYIVPTSSNGPRYGFPPIQIHTSSPI
jgi:hypothetical protein